MSDSTNPAATGSTTTEAKTTRVIQIVAGVLAAAGAALGALQEQFPDSKWIALGAMAIGGLVTLLTQLGLIKSRTIIKATMISNGLPSGVVQTPAPTEPPK